MTKTPKVYLRKLKKVQKALSQDCKSKENEQNKDEKSKY